MEHYQLQADEVVLFHAQASLLKGGKKTETEVFLTNLYFVFINKTKRFLKKSEVDTERYDAQSVKRYKEVPHIIRKGKTVEVYFTQTEKFIEFATRKDAVAFADKALRLVSGQSKFVRAVKKTQKEINETDEALGTDIVGTTKKVAGIAAEVAVGVGGIAGAGKKAKVIGVIGGVFKSKNKEKSEQKDEQDQKAIAKLKELKELLDNGTITQEEFDKMKQAHIS